MICDPTYKEHSHHSHLLTTSMKPDSAIEFMTFRSQASASHLPVSWKSSAGRRIKKRVNIWTSVTSHAWGTSDLCVAFPLPPICPAIRALRARSSCGSQKGTATVGCQSLMVQPCVHSHQGHQQCMESSTSFREKHPKWFNLIKQNLTTHNHMWHCI